VQETSKLFRELADVGAVLSFLFSSKPNLPANKDKPKQTTSRQLNWLSMSRVGIGPDDPPPDLYRLPGNSRLGLDAIVCNLIHLDLFKQDLHRAIVDQLKEDVDLEFTMSGGLIGRQALLSAYINFRKRVDGEGSRYINIYATCCRQLLDEEYGTDLEQTWMFQIVREREQVNRDVEQAEFELAEATAAVEVIDGSISNANDDIAQQLVPLARLLSEALEDPTRRTEIQASIPHWIAHMEEITELIQGGPRAQSDLPEMIASLQARLEQLSTTSTV
jgi:hypothetical protein